MQNFKKDNLTVKIYETRAEMGTNAGKDISNCIKALLNEKDELNMIFAAAPSQNEVLDYLANDKTIPFEKINAFHMDEYVGIDKTAPQGFAMFLNNALFDKVPFKSVNTLDSTADPDEESKRYSKLLSENPVDIVCMGIGENGHIAFNDPHVADFNDANLVKKVDLDDVCRMQQVHDGCFATLDDVPKYALTLTVPALAAGKYQFCVVPASTKANAVKNTIYGDIDEKCPATILRRLDNAILYCDNESGALIKG